MKSLGRYRILMLLAGIATAMVIVFSQLFYFQAATYCQKKVDAEQHDQKTGHESYISIPSSTISSTSHIEINQDLSFLLGILFEVKSEQEESTEIVFPVDRFFQTLFRFIISPNAP
jgi:hypothetical protein